MHSALDCYSYIYNGSKEKHTLHFIAASCHLFYSRAFSAALLTHCTASCSLCGPVERASGRAPEAGVTFVWPAFPPPPPLPPARILKWDSTPHACAVLTFVFLLRWTPSPACWEELWWPARSSRPSASHQEENCKVNISRVYFAGRGHAGIVYPGHSKSPYSTVYLWLNSVMTKSWNLNLLHYLMKNNIIKYEAGAIEVSALCCK